jgi:hypothetical protein
LAVFGAPYARRIAQSELARLVSAGHAQGDVFLGVGWLQAPQIQAITGNYFFNGKDKRQLKELLSRHQKIFVVYTPESHGKFLFGRHQESVIWDHSGYELTKVDGDVLGTIQK